MSNRTVLPEEGKTFHGPTAVIPDPATDSLRTLGLEGTITKFTNTKQTTQTEIVRNRINDGFRYAILLRNVSAGVLAAGAVVKFSNDYFLRRVDGESGTANMLAAGVVDPKLPSSGCRVNDLCWVFFRGLCLVNKPSATAQSQGGILFPNDSGEAVVVATAQSNPHLGVVAADAAAIDTQVLAALAYDWE